MSDRLQFIQAVSQVPQMAQLVNYEAILYDIVQHFGFDDPDSYLNTNQNSSLPSQTPGSLLSQGEEQELVNTAQQVGGQAMANAMQANVKADGAREAVRGMTGQDINPLQAEMEAQAQLMQGA